MPEAKTKPWDGLAGVDDPIAESQMYGEGLYL